MATNGTCDLRSPVDHCECVAVHMLDILYIEMLHNTKKVTLFLRLKNSHEF